MRIIYNTTYLVDNSIDVEWKGFITNVYIPKLMTTNCFDEWKLSKIFGEPSEGAISYALQFVAKDFNSFLFYRDNFSKSYQKEVSSRFNEKCIHFKTLMEVFAES